jgi:hypothetical protein
VFAEVVDHCSLDAVTPVAAALQTRRTQMPMCLLFDDSGMRTVRSHLPFLSRNIKHVPFAPFRTESSRNSQARHPSKP